MLDPDIEYVKNADGDVEVYPLMQWNVQNYGAGVFVQLSFASTPEELEEGILGTVQLNVGAELALQLAEQLTAAAKGSLADQAGQMPTKAQ